MGKPRISVCMIVKNEEKKLERALSWGNDIFWEKIVVDTGSADGTVSLAERLGAKVCHFDWIDDFAAARNFALEQAGGDWILTLDADEWPAPETPEKLLSLVKQAEEKRMDGIVGGILDLNEEGKIALNSARIRLFRNDPDIRYRRRIHEFIEFLDGRKMRLMDAVETLVVFHDGYVGAANKKKMADRRNLNLLEQEILDHPDDYDIMGYLGDEYRSRGNTEKAMEWYRRSVERMPEKLQETAPRAVKTFTDLIMLYTANENYQEAERIYGLAIRLQPKDGDFDYLMGRACMGEEHWEEAADYLSRGLAKLERYGAMNRSMIISANLKNVYESLGLCYLKSGRRKEAVQTAVALLRADSYNLRGMYVLLLAFYEDGGERADEQSYLDSVTGFLGKMYLLSDLKNRLFIARAAKEAGWEMLCRQMEESLKP